MEADLIMKINLILLASGFSRRFNGNKLLTDFCGRPLYMYVIDEVMKIYMEDNFKFNKIICVTQYEEIKDSLKGTPMKVIINENSSFGISNSIKLGINYDTEADGYMFIVCDQPFIKKETLSYVMDVFCKGNKGITAIGRNDMIGNPVIFSRKYIDELLSLQGDVGGKKIVKRHLDDVEIVQIDDELQFADIDTVEAYERFAQEKKYKTLD